jgi:hypothetical protein
VYDTSYSGLSEALICFLRAQMNAFSWKLLVFVPFLLLDTGNYSEAMSSHAGLHAAKKCEALGLCSLGHVKPFLGDIYNSELF